MENGSNDRLWCDGANLYLVRNHIISYRKQIEEHCNVKGIELPLIMSVHIPDPVDQKFNSDKKNKYPDHPYYQANELGQADIKKLTTPEFEQLSLFT